MSSLNDCEDSGALKLTELKISHNVFLKSEGTSSWNSSIRTSVTAVIIVDGCDKESTALPVVLVLAFLS